MSDRPGTLRTQPYNVGVHVRAGSTLVAIGPDGQGLQFPMPLSYDTIITDALQGDRTVPLTDTNTMVVPLPAGVRVEQVLTNGGQIGAYGEDRKRVWMGPLPAGTVLVVFTPGGD